MKSEEVAILLKHHPDMLSETIMNRLNIDIDELLDAYSEIQNSSDVDNRSRFISLSSDLLSSHSKLIEALLCGDRIAPLILEIHPGRECQGACEFCFSHEIDYEVAESCSLFQYTIALMKCKELGVKEIWFSGGKEPLTNPDTPVLIAYCNDLGFSTRLYTNGVLLDKYVCKHIMRSSQVRISLNAPDEKTYREVFGANGSFDSVVDNIERLVRYKDETNSSVRIVVSMVVHPANYDKIEEFVYLVECLGADLVQLRLDSIGRIPSLSRSQETIVIDQVNDLVRFTPRIELDYRGILDGELESGKLLPFLKRPELCRAGLLKRAIDPFGGVWYCEFSSHPAFRFDNRHLECGNIMHESIEDIFRRMSFHRYPICKFCQAHEHGLNVLFEKLVFDIKCGIMPSQQPWSRRSRGFAV